MVNVCCLPLCQELPVSQGIFVPDKLAHQLLGGASSIRAEEQAGVRTETVTGEDTAANDDGSHPQGRWYHYASADDGVGGGIDEVEFLLAAGPGEPLRPLASVASGGESARVLLALKASPALAVADDAEAAAAGIATSFTSTTASPPSPSSSSSFLGMPVLILDELDSSIGARLGSAVGRILRKMCTAPRPASGQIICVTHLPQVS